MYIGIDQSYGGCGLAFLDDQGELISSTVLDKHTADYKSMVDIANQIVDVLRKARLSDDVQVAIEHTGFGHRSSSRYSMQVALTGAIIYGLINIGIEPRIIHVQQWKSDVMNNRLRKMKKATKAQKKEYLQVVMSETGYLFETPDEADAFCIAEKLRRQQKKGGSKCQSKTNSVSA